MLIRHLSLIVFCFSAAGAQIDTIRHAWPVPPFNSPHPITGVFGEFRNTGTSDHFHNGVDIPKTDGSPAYSVFNGVVTAIGTVASSGSNAYVRIQYNVGGMIKSDAYVHIAPNPLLNVNDSVYAGLTVLGNVITGQGHVHFTNGYVGYEMNGIRPVGGLSPYTDIFPPKIVSTRFFLDETNIEMTGGIVSGAVDIRVHIRETNAGDTASVTSSVSNNGTYIAGYKILTADRSAIVYEPPSAGVRYRFDTKPSNTYVSRVYAPGSDLSTHIYTITNGDGADYINSTSVVSNNSWNTNIMPVGNYSVMIFAIDTRGLADTVYVPIQVTRQDLIPCSPPILHSILNDSTNRITVRWYPNPEADLKGYRLYFSADGVSWVLRDNETKLLSSVTSISYTIGSSGKIFFRLAAVDSATPTNVSEFSDTYGIRINLPSAKTLIVDGFDRTELSGSYHDRQHPFVLIHAVSIPTNFSSCSNDAVIDGDVTLNEYDVVVWVLGDESTYDRTFNPVEQANVKAYLQQGGRLFVSGSEIAWDLDRPSGPTQTDRDFLRDFLKARYAGDNSNEYSVSGVAATHLDGLSFRYGVVTEGSPYPEDYPDYLTPEGGSHVILKYGSGVAASNAGVAFKGLFSGGTQPGGVVYLGFPFETITVRGIRDSIMNRVFAYFDMLSSAWSSAAGVKVPTQIQLRQNYPNPFNPSTTIEYDLPYKAMVSLTVFDILGREIDHLVDEVKEAGTHRVQFDGTKTASGVYFYRIEVRTSDEAILHIDSRKMMVVK